MPARAGHGRGATAAAAQHGGRAHKRIHCRVQREKAVEHRGEQIKPAVLPGALLEFERHVESAAECAGTGAGDACGSWRRGDADKRVDRGAGFPPNSLRS